MNSGVSPHGSDAGRKPYSRPSIRIYGTMEEITRQGSGVGAGDNTSGPKSNGKTGG
jgi:hypothetical protein